MRLLLLVMASFGWAQLLADEEVIALPGQPEESRWELVREVWRADFLPATQGNAVAPAVQKRYAMVLAWDDAHLREGQNHTNKIRADGYVGRSPLGQGEAYMTPDHPTKGFMYFKSRKGYVMGWAVDEVVVQKDPIVVYRWERQRPPFKEVFVRTFYWVRCHGICRNDYLAVAVRDSFTKVELPAPERVETLLERSAKTEKVTVNASAQGGAVHRVVNTQNWTVPHGRPAQRKTELDIYVRPSKNGRVTNLGGVCTGTAPALGGGPAIQLPPVTTPPNNPEHDPRVPGTGPN